MLGDLYLLNMSNMCLCHLQTDLYGRPPSLAKVRMATTQGAQAVYIHLGTLNELPRDTNARVSYLGLSNFKLSCCDVC